MAGDPLTWPVFNVEVGRYPWMMQVVDDQTGTAPEVGQDLYIFEKNPNRMSSPFAKVDISESYEVLRNYSYLVTPGLSPNRVISRTKMEPKVFSFSGRIRSEEQFIRMSDFYGYDLPIALRDHYGRVFLVRFISFSCEPKVSTLRYSHIYDYEMQCQVYRYLGISGRLWQDAMLSGRSFNGFGQGALSVDSLDAATGVTTWTIAHDEDIRSDWIALGGPSWRSNWHDEVSSWSSVTNVNDDARYKIWVLDPPWSLYQALANSGASTHDQAIRCISGIAHSLCANLETNNIFSDGIVALGVAPREDLAANGAEGWVYRQAYAVFSHHVSSAVAPSGARLLTAMNRMSSIDSAFGSWDFGGMFYTTDLCCMYMRVNVSAPLEDYLDRIYAFRENMFIRGVPSAVSVAIDSPPSGETKGSTYTKLYDACREEAPGLIRVGMYWYEDYRVPMDQGQNMLNAYSTVISTPESVTGEIIGLA